MKRLVMTRLIGADALPGGEGALVQLETSEGPFELRFTFEDAERLIDALHGARQALQARRAEAAKPPLPEAQKAVERWETAIDPINQEAVLRAHHADRTTRETRIARSHVAAIAEFLGQACRRFAGSADLRQ